MKSTKSSQSIVIAILGLVLVHGLCASPLGPAFTYQGRLMDGAFAAHGHYDLRFTLYDAAENGAQIGTTVTNTLVSVTNGLFTVNLDFGSSVFNGSARWLEMGVRTNGVGSFTSLSPRQPLTPAPYALYAPNAGTAVSASAATAVPWAGISGLPGGFADGVDNDTTYSAGTGLGLSGNIFSLNSTFTDNRYWKLGGNSGTTPGTHFLGTGDGQPLELHAGYRAMRFEIGAIDQGPNIVGGYRANAVSPGRSGSTVAGGGSDPYPHRIESQYGTISGGEGNRLRTNSDFGAISGGRYNTIGPGSAYGFIGGGRYNSIDTNAPGSTIGGGTNNSIATGSTNALIVGGEANRIAGASERAAIVGGSANNIGTNSDSSVIAGGSLNTVGDGSWGAAIVGGYGNDIADNSDDATIGGGYDNNIGGNSFEATIAGGRGNFIGNAAPYSIVGGGYRNGMVSTAYGTIAGGDGNTIGSDSAGSSIGGGIINSIANTSESATVSGGSLNSIGSWAHYASIAGGYNNTIANNSPYATIPGGRDNFAAAYAFAAGRRATANDRGSFVWADSNDFDFASTVADGFFVRAVGGVKFVTAVTTNGAQSAGVRLVSGSSTWTTLSDRNSKSNTKTVDTQTLLEKLATIPIQTWNWNAQDPSIRHIGPMAQDFYSAFGVGEDDKHITTVDADGVALAAIQGLNQKVEVQNRELRARLNQREQEIDELKRVVASLKQRVEQLSP